MRSKFLRYLKSTRAAVAVEFALVLPALLLITIGTLDLTLALAEIHLNNEAARAAGRVAIIGDPVADMVYDETATVVCTGAGTLASVTYTCSGGDSNLNTAEFQAIVDAAAVSKTDLLPANLSVSYVPSGLDQNVVTGSGTALVTTPLVTVRIANNSYTTIILDIIPGIGSSMALPDATVTRMSPSVITSLS